MHTIEFIAKAQNWAIILPEVLSDFDNEFMVTITWENAIEKSFESKKSKFSAVKLSTKGYKFDRDKACERF